jgi:uncharacterized protein involved in type VI secretion and phage assembly
MGGAGRHRDNGAVIGIVASLDDPETLGRVQLHYPYLADASSAWARIAAPFAGPDRGFVSLPEVGDEVLVVFEHGDPRRPYIVGGVWSKVDKQPSGDGKKTENNWRFVKSRSGHVIKLDDTSGAERIEIVDRDGARRVVIDTANKKIQVMCDTGDVEVSAPSGSVKIDATTVEIKSSKDMSLKATGSLSLSGLTVDIN